MAGAAAFDLEKELGTVLDKERELVAMAANDKPFEAGRQQILPPDAGGKDDKAIDKKERVAIINKVKADRGLTGKTAYFDAQRIAMQEGLLPSKVGKKKPEQKPEQKPEKPEKKPGQNPEERPKKRGRRVDDDKGDILQKIMGGGGIETAEEFACARKLLASQNTMMLRALKTCKGDHMQYTQNFTAVERAINLAAPTFDPKYTARDLDNTKTMRTALNCVAKLSEAARQGNSESRDKDAEIARLKAMLAAQES